ncbi:MAG TPA: Sec-independent protein translocase protein TatB [Pelagibacteraceae bacterium]|jgi:sec-independent protein translocase protein TatB|nr:Sec-independent protein translocase protein TatB [Pelagibacteraceae bacterium]|tara:strand:+ start:4846 stop:5085 length:240 start_codon:yes stop_codon:yes gene_type:complete
MPQIGWFEILIIVVLSILIIGPKDFPVMLRKIGSWIGSVKRYFNEIQKDITDMENTIEDEISLKKNYLNQTKDKKKDER